MCRKYGKFRNKTIKRESREESNVTNAEGETNKSTSKLLTSELTGNLSEAFVLEHGQQEFRSETLLAYTKHVLKKTFLVMDEHLIVQTEENFDYTMTETKKEHTSLAFASKKQILEDPSVHFKLLQGSAEACTV